MDEPTRKQAEEAHRGMDEPVTAKLRPGWVVRCVKTSRNYRAGAPDQRGVVTWAEGCGNHLSHGGTLAPARGEVVIRFSAGHHLYTTYTNEWERVPEEEWTAIERVWSANATYLPPNWYDDGDRVSDTDTYEWWLMRALLSQRHLDKVFPENGDWPTDWLEFALAVASCLDFDAAATAATFT